MTTVLWLSNPATYRLLKTYRPEMAEQALICTADLETLWLLQREGVPVRSLWRLVTLDDQLSIAAQARDLADTWTAGLADVSYQGLHLGALCQTSLLYFFRDVLFAQCMAARFLDEVQPTKLLVSPSIASSSAGQQTAAWVWEATQRQIPVEVVPGGQPGSSLPAARPAGRIRRGLRRLGDALTWKLSRPGRSRGEQPRIAFFGGGADLVNQRAVIERLQATRPYRVAQFSLDPVQRSAVSRSQPAGQFAATSLLPYASPRHYRELQALGQAAWASFQRLQGDSPAGPHAVLFANPALKPMFQTFFLDTIPRVGGALGVASSVLDAFRPQLVFLNNDTSGRARAIVEAARRLDIPSAQLIHSGFNDLDFRRFATDQMWVWGDVHRQQLAALDLPSERIRVTGNPNFDYLVKRHLDGSLSQTRQETRRKLALDEDEIVLLLITAKPPYLLAFVDLEQHGEDLRIIGQALDDLPNVRLVVKPHPRYDDTTVHRHLAEQHSRVTIVEGVFLDQLLPACDVALMVNVASTGGIEALALGKPLVWIRPSVRYPDHYSVFESVALVVEERDGIAPAIGRLVRSPEQRRQLAALGQRHLPEILAHLDATATDAVVSAVDDSLLPQRKRRQS